jgi:hypothetical protein
MLLIWLIRSRLLDMICNRYKESLDEFNSLLNGELRTKEKPFYIYNYKHLGFIGILRKQQRKLLMFRAVSLFYKQPHIKPPGTFYFLILKKFL